MPEIKRFYKTVSVYESEGGYGVELDGKPIKTPAGKPLLAKSKSIADHLMLEWAAQEQVVRPEKMPVNQIFITALDQTGSREKSLDHIESFAETDFVFFRSDKDPYKARQDSSWGKWSRWFEERFDITLNITDQIMPLQQDQKLTGLIRSYCENLDDLRLALYETVLEDTSSNILTIAFFEKAATADDIYEAVFIDDMIRAEIYDEAKYGAAPDQEKMRETVRRNLAAGEKILST